MRKLEHARYAWAFLRTHGRDYRKGVDLQGEYPWVKLGPDYCPHLRYFLFHDGLLQTWLTRDAARCWGKAMGERGVAARVQVTTRLA
jgi:hypothetical protein